MKVAKTLLHFSSMARNGFTAIHFSDEMQADSYDFTENSLDKWKIASRLTADMLPSLQSSTIRFAQ